MKKPITLALGILSVASMSLSYADSIFVENTDNSKVKIYWGDKLAIGTDISRIYNDTNPEPDQRELKILVDNGTTLTLKLVTSNSVAHYECNYTLLVSKNHGWRLDSFNVNNGCTPSQNNYRPPSPDDPIYQVVNKSDHSIYPAFSIKRQGYAADSILGYVKPGELRIYSLAGEYWKYNHVYQGTELGVAVFDPFLNKYVDCEGSEPAKGSKVFIYSADHTCFLDSGSER